MKRYGLSELTVAVNDRHGQKVISVEVASSRKMYFCFDTPAFRAPRPLRQRPTPKDVQDARLRLKQQVVDSFNSVFKGRFIGT